MGFVREYLFFKLYYKLLFYYLLCFIQYVGGQMVIKSQVVAVLAKMDFSPDITSVKHKF